MSLRPRFHPSIPLLLLLPLGAPMAACYRARAVHPASVVTLDRSAVSGSLPGLDGVAVPYDRRDSLRLTHGGAVDRIKIAHTTVRADTAELIVDDPIRGSVAFKISELTAVHLRRPTLRLKNPGLVVGGIVTSVLAAGVLTLCVLDGCDLAFF